MLSRRLSLGANNGGTWCTITLGKAVAKISFLAAGKFSLEVQYYKQMVGHMMFFIQQVSELRTFPAGWALDVDVRMSPCSSEQ